MVKNVVGKYKQFPTFEYVEVGAEDKQNFMEEPALLWRIDYENGQAVYWEEGPSDLVYNHEKWIRFSGSIEDYLIDRGCKNVQESSGWKYTFKEVA
jgi:hypothetical protein